MIFCSLCIKYFPDIRQYLDHTKKKPHKMKPGTPIHCPFVSCKRFYTLRKSLVKHFLSEHPDKSKVPNVQTCAEVSKLENSEISLSNTNNVHVAAELEQKSIAVCTTAPLDDLPTKCQTEKKTNVNIKSPPDILISDFMSKIKESIVNFFGLVNSFPAIPFTFIQLITDNLISTCSDINGIFIKKLSNLHQYLHDETSKKILSDCIELYDFTNATFASFKSVYRQIKFFEKQGFFIKPQKKSLRQRIIMRKKKGGRYVATPVKQTSIVIPMKKVLSKFLSQKNVLEDVLKHKEKLETEKEYLSNIIQGGTWGKIPSRNEGVILPLAFFNDDFEPDNALGGHAGTNKINGSYYWIPCLPPQIQSSLSTIFLVMVTKASNKKYCGNRTTFQPIIDELKDLYTNGITIRTSDSKNVQIFFQLIILVGDNLGLNGIGGFVENFSKAKHCCRICYADLNQRRHMLVEDVSLLRTLEKYDGDVLLNNPTETGIKENCVFNDVPNFHIVSNCSVDIMHDIFESVAKNDILFILKTYVYDYKLLSLSDFNGRISRFRFGSADMSSKPPIFRQGCFKKTSFNISASECMCLVKYLGLLIGDLVPPDDPVWTLYIALRRIVDIVLSPVVHKESSDLLRSYVEEHHGLYLKLTNKKLTLKYHNLIHYPGLIPKVGPLRNIWAMRGEGKHRVLKSTSNSIASRRNICLSVANKHQLQLSFNFFSSKFSTDNLKWGSTVRNCSLKLLKDNLTTHIPESLLKEDIVQTSWVNVNRIRYSPGVSLFVDLDEISSLPLFGELVEIYISGSKKIYFLMKNFQTVAFNEKLFAYQVNYTDSYSIFQYDDVHDPQLNSVVPVLGGDLYISLLYNS